MNRVKVTWEFDDGYAGGSRPQHTYIDESDFIDCETQEEYQAIIENAIQQDFETKGYSIEDIDWGNIKPPEE